MCDYVSSSGVIFFPVFHLFFFQKFPVYCSTCFFTFIFIQLKKGRLFLFFVTVIGRHRSHTGKYTIVHGDPFPFDLVE